jgi:hypothetical protein
MVDVVMVSEAVAGLLAAGGTVTQQVRAGRDAYVAGRDQRVHNCRQPGE